MTDDLIQTAIDFVCGGSIGLMAWFFGGRDGFLMVLIAFMVIDQLSGLAAGWKEHKLSSDTGFTGVLRKGIILAFVGMAHLIDTYILKDTMLGNTEAIRNGVCMFYIANEGISIFENAERLNIPVPAFIRNRLDNLKKFSAGKDKDKETKKAK